MNEGKGKIVSLPDSFQAQTGNVNSFGTYSATIKIPKDLIGKALAIHVPYQYSAYTLFVDQSEIAKNGKVGQNSLSHDAEMSPEIGTFFPQSDELLLTMQLSSFDHIRGGFENSIYLGESSAVSRKFNKDIIVTLFINGCIFIIGLFMVLFALFRRREHVFLVFGIFSMLISVRALFTVPFYYKLIFLEMSWLWGTRLEYILTEASSMFYIILLWYWHKEEFSKKVVSVLVAIHLSLIVTTLFTQPVFFQALFFKVFYLAVPTFFYLIYVIYKSIRNHNRDAKVNLIGIGIIFLAFFNDFAVGKNFYQSINLMLPAVAVYVFMHVILMSKDFAERTQKTERQNKQLLSLNVANEKLAIQLQKEMKQKDDFLANTSHELRNPLHGIINITQITHEIELLESYLYIEKERFGERLHVNWEVDEDIDGMIPPLSIQVLVENAVNHGVLKRIDGGVITIRICEKEDSIEVSVLDNGVGMDEEKVKQLFTIQPDRTQRIGLINTEQRLQRLYSKGLSIHSTEGVGTSITFTVPNTISSV